MSCGSADIARINIDQGGVPDNLPSLVGADSGSPGLFVSNAPEQIGDGGEDIPGSQTNEKHWVFQGPVMNLCRVRLTGEDIPARVRVFFWHISRFDVTTYWSVRVGSEGEGGTVSNLVGEVASTALTGNLSTAGMCLADSQLFGTLDSLSSGTWNIATEQGVWEIEVPAGSQTISQFRLVAAVLEFDVEAESVLTIRSAVTKTSGTWGTYATALADPESNFNTAIAHVRGYWRRAGITLSIPVYDANPLLSAPHSRDTGLCDTGGPEAAYYAEQNSLAEASKGNMGCFGANLTYEGELTNSSTILNAEVQIAICCRGTGAKYFGAGQILLPTPTSDPKKLTPIPASWSNDDPPVSSNPRGYNLTALRGGNIGIPKVVTAATNVFYRFKMANAGGAAMPTNLRLSRFAVQGDPPGGGGDS